MEEFHELKDIGKMMFLTVNTNIKAKFVQDEYCLKKISRITTKQKCFLEGHCSNIHRENGSIFGLF